MLPSGSDQTHMRVRLLDYLDQLGLLLVDARHVVQEYILIAEIKAAVRLVQVVLPRAQYGERGAIGARAEITAPPATKSG